MSGRLVKCDASERKVRRKVLIGSVTSCTGEKTVKVTYNYKIPHPRYKKEISRKTVVHAHDESSQCRRGDKVEIIETRPLSKLKRWRVKRVVEKVPEVNA